MKATSPKVLTQKSSWNPQTQCPPSVDPFCPKRKFSKPTFSTLTTQSASQCWLKNCTCQQTPVFSSLKPYRFCPCCHHQEPKLKLNLDPYQ